MRSFNKVDKMDDNIAVIGVGCNFPGGKVASIILNNLINMM